MEPRVIQIGNYRESEDRKFDNPQCGRVYSVDGLSPTINTCQGGDREPKILLEMEEIKSCASCKSGEEHKIETRNDDVANYVTSIDTDSMVCEPTKVVGSMQEHAYQGSVDGISPCVNAAAGMGGGHIPMVVEEPQFLTPLRTEEVKRLCNQGIDTFSNKALYPRTDGTSNCLTGVLKDNLLQESKIVGYSRDEKGKITSHHFKYMANTITGSGTQGGSTSQYVAEAVQELKEIAQNGRSCEVEVSVNADCSLRPYNKNTKAKDGISEFMTQYEENSANTVTTSHGGNVYGQITRYRIRKLTEREVFRLMDVSEEDIDKIQSAGISKTAQYKLAGNSIVVSCLYHIFRKMFVEPECEDIQGSLF